MTLLDNYFLNYQLYRNTIPSLGRVLILFRTGASQIVVYPVLLGQRGQKPILCPAACPRIAQVRENPPPPP